MSRNKRNITYTGSCLLLSNAQQDVSITIQTQKIHDDVHISLYPSF